MLLLTGQCAQHEGDIAGAVPRKLDEGQGPVLSGGGSVLQLCAWWSPHSPNCATAHLATFAAQVGQQHQILLGVCWGKVVLKLNLPCRGLHICSQFTWQRPKHSQHSSLPTLLIDPVTRNL